MSLCIMLYFPVNVLYIKYNIIVVTRYSITSCETFITKLAFKEKYRALLHYNLHAEKCEPIALK